MSVVVPRISLLLGRTKYSARLLARREPGLSCQARGCRSDSLVQVELARLEETGFGTGVENPDAGGNEQGKIRVGGDEAFLEADCVLRDPVLSFGLQVVPVKRQLASMELDPEDHAPSGVQAELGWAQRNAPACRVSRTTARGNARSGDTISWPRTDLGENAMRVILIVVLALAASPLVSEADDAAAAPYCGTECRGLGIEKVKAGDEHCGLVPPRRKDEALEAACRLARKHREELQARAQEKAWEKCRKVNERKGCRCAGEIRRWQNVYTHVMSQRCWTECGWAYLIECEREPEAGGGSPQPNAPPRVSVDSDDDAGSAAQRARSRPSGRH